MQIFLCFLLYFYLYTFLFTMVFLPTGFPGGTGHANAGDVRDEVSVPGSEGAETHSSIPAWRIHGQRSLAGCSPWGRKEADTTEAV